jgi:hypothetical protein
VRLVRRVLPFVLALAALALAGVSAYAGREAGRVDSELRRSDAAFRVEPVRGGLWELDTRVPALQTALGIDDDVKFRRASRLFELLRQRGHDPYDFAARAFRADAQLALARAQQAGLARRARSKAANLEGVLVLDEALGDPRNGPALFNRSLGHFRRAIRIDPTNQEAAFNVELLLRLLRPEAARLAIRYGVNTKGRGVAGAGAVRRGHGY